MAAILFVLGIMIMTASNSLVSLMLGRLFVGLGVGFGFAVSIQLITIIEFEIYPKILILFCNYHRSIQFILPRLHLLLTEVV